MSDSIFNPYTSLPDSAFWRKAVSELHPDDIRPLLSPPYELSADTAIATAGSCFAQHISTRLERSGANILRTEVAHPLIFKEVADDFFFNAYSARFGNIYTSRQLLQLFQRAYGILVPAEEYWRSADRTSFLDPFRPTITPGGYWSKEELSIARKKHLAAVRQMFEKMDILIFTMGLTECWRSRIDGSVFPVCPGVAGGVFDAEKYEFLNLNVQDICNDFSVFLQLLASKNPDAKIILTVSPVNIVATREQRHVVESSICTKSILRAACDQITREHEQVSYFPSYEMAIASYTRGNFYTENCRAITEAGANFVSRAFISHFFGSRLDGASQKPAAVDTFAQQMEAACKVLCDEELLEKLIE